MNRWTTVGAMLRRGDRKGAIREIRHALIYTNGQINHAAWILNVTRKRLYEWIHILDLYPVVDACRRRELVSTWAAITAAVLKRGRPMPAWEKVMRGIQGMNVDDVKESLARSKHAARIPDLDAFAQGLVDAAAAWEPDA